MSESRGVCTKEMSEERGGAATHSEEKNTKLRREVGSVDELRDKQAMTSEGGNQGEKASGGRADMHTSDDDGGIANGGKRREKVKIAMNLTKGRSVRRLQQDGLMGS